MAGDDRNMSSLSRMLQWSVQESTKDGRTAQEVDPDFLEKNRHIIDQMFPDEYAMIEFLRRRALGEAVPVTDGTGELAAQATSGTNGLTVEDRVNALEALEEYAQDLNYAENFKKVGVLQAAIHCAMGAESDERIRSTAVWILGTAMQDLKSVKDDVVALGGLDVLKRALHDPSPKVRAKGVMASSALLRNAPDFARAFTESGALELLANCLHDEDELPRRRALFFLEHSRGTNADYFADYVSKDDRLVRSLLDRCLGKDDVDVARAIASAVVSSAPGRETIRRIADGESRLADTCRRESIDIDLKKELLQILVQLKR